MAPVAYFFIPDSPDKARFLNSEEKTIARARAVRQAGTIERVGKVDFSELLQTFRDPKAWCMAVRTPYRYCSSARVTNIDFGSYSTSPPMSATLACLFSSPGSSMRWATAVSMRKAFPHLPTSALSSVHCSRRTLRTEPDREAWCLQ